MHVCLFIYIYIYIYITTRCSDFHHYLKHFRYTEVLTKDAAKIKANIRMVLEVQILRFTCLSCFQFIVMLKTICFHRVWGNCKGWKIFQRTEGERCFRTVHRSQHSVLYLHMLWLTALWQSGSEEHGLLTGYTVVLKSLLNKYIFSTTVSHCYHFK